MQYVDHEHFAGIDTIENEVVSMHSAPQARCLASRQKRISLRVCRDLPTMSLDLIDERSGAVRTVARDLLTDASQIVASLVDYDELHQPLPSWPWRDISCAAYRTPARQASRDQRLRQRRRGPTPHRELLAAFHAREEDEDLRAIPRS